MATLYNILKTFKETLAAHTSVDPANIVLDDQDKAESTPAIVYEPFPTKVTFNGVGQGPDRKIRDSNDVVVDHEHDEFIEVRFEVTPIADSESELLPIYEDIRQALRPYEEWKSSHDFHVDAESITIDDSSSSDERSFRGQSIDVYILFTRVTSRWGDVTDKPTPITDIEISVSGSGES